MNSALGLSLNSKIDRVLKMRIKNDKWAQIRNEKFDFHSELFDASLASE